MTDPRVREALRLLTRDLKSTPRLAEVARAVNLSVPHLRRLIEAETGAPPARHLKALRLRRARELVEGTFLTVRQVMLEVGVGDESHFVRDFRRAFGLPPMAHRRRFCDLAAAGDQIGQRMSKSASK